MSKVIQIIDEETGELFGTRLVNVHKNSRYIRMGEEALGLPLSILRVSQYIAFVVASDTNCFYANPEFKKKMIETMKFSEARYFQVMRELKDAKVIIPLGKKVYMLNPKLFFRCVYSMRQKLVAKYERLVYRVHDVGGN